MSGDMTKDAPFRMKIKKYSGLLAWLLAILVCAGLVRFVFWQKAIAKSMEPYLASMPVVTTPIAAPDEQTAAAMPAFVPKAGLDLLMREPETHTELTSEFRTAPIEYTVVSGDSVWAISNSYGLTVESLLYANYDILQDKSDNLMPGQVLTIPPTDGILHKWRKNDTISSVASRYGAAINDILLFIGNNFDLSDPKVETGATVMVPGGARQLLEISYAAVTTDALGNRVSGFDGPGACTISGVGLFGSGSFIWPSSVHYISGNQYGPGHRAIDIGAGMGSPLFAADSGTVVYAGWMNGGYGNFVVIDHGNGFQTLYEHLDQIHVSCGDNIFQGSQIGTSGTTGNSTGAHLHFEIRYAGAAVNPWDYLP